MGQKPTEGYSERLREALNHGPQPMSPRTLSEKLSARHAHLRGTSYGGIRSYADGRVRNPRLELLRAIGEILDVRWEWLAYNRGAMTEAEERARTKRSGMAAIKDRDFALWEEAVEVKRATLFGLLGLAENDHFIRYEGRRLIEIPHWVAPVAEVCRRLHVDPYPLGVAFRGPLAALGIDPLRMSHDSLSDYITAMVPVLLALVDERARGFDPASPSLPPSFQEE